MSLNRVLLIVALAACPSGTDLTSGREYPCSRDGGAPQCAEGWRCGLDERCHSATQGAPLACATDDDCAPGWKCGRDAVCHDSKVAAAYPCDSDSDCEGGWRCTCCGAGRVCHPPVGAPWPCRSASDCEASWSCGPEGLCHDPDAGTAYPCADDAQCGGGWRCGLDGVCVDWRLEGLRAGLYEGPLDEARLNPATMPAPVLVSASALGESFALANATTVTHVQPPNVVSIAADAGTLASIGARTYFTDDLGLVELTWTPDGGTTRRWPIGAGSTRLRAWSTDAGALLAGVSGGGVWLHDVTRDVSIPPLPLPQQIFDVAVNGADVIAATDEGLFASQYTGSALTPWQPAVFGVLPNLQCGPLDGGDARRVRALDVWDGLLIMLAEPWPGDGGTDAFFGSASFAAGGCGSTLGLGFCFDPVCAPGEHAVDFTEDTYWCRSTDGLVEHVNALSGCTRVPDYGWPLAGLTVAGHSTEGYSAHADVAGHVVSSGAAFTAPLTQSLMRVGSRRWMGTTWVEAPGIGFVPGTLGLLESNAWFTYPGIYPFEPAFVFGPSLDWAFAISGNSALSGRVYQLTSGTLELETTFDQTMGAPQVAAFATTPDGGQLLVAAFNDQLAAADLSAEEQLTVKLAPRPFDAIRAVAMLPPTTQSDGGAPLASGYLLTGTALFHIVAHSALRWSADELTAPDGARLSVWTDGAAGRVGYSDGTVVSLPSRVTLSQPLPGGDRVVQYAQVCGQPIALAQGGLYRLSASGSWELEALPSLGPDRDFDAGRLDLDGDRLLVSTGGGTLVQLTLPMSCP